MSKPKIPLSEQIAEVGREVGLRRRGYPRLVGMGQLARAEADHYLAQNERRARVAAAARQERDAHPRAAPVGGQAQAREARMILSRLVAGLLIALGLAAAASAAWVVCRAPHCRPAPAHASYTPLERCR